MTREELTKVPGFSQWASDPTTVKFLGLFADTIDSDLGNAPFSMEQPHFVHVNFGVSWAVRRMLILLRNPLAAPPERVPLPPARYGVKQE